METLKLKGKMENFEEFLTGLRVGSLFPEAVIQADKNTGKIYSTQIGDKNIIRYYVYTALNVMSSGTVKLDCEKILKTIKMYFSKDDEITLQEVVENNEHKLAIGNSKWQRHTSIKKLTDEEKQLLEKYGDKRPFKKIEADGTPWILGGEKKLGTHITLGIEEFKKIANSSSLDNIAEQWRFKVDKNKGVEIVVGDAIGMIDVVHARPKASIINSEDADITFTVAVRDIASTMRGNVHIYVSNGAPGWFWEEDRFYSLGVFVPPKQLSESDLGLETEKPQSDEAVVVVVEEEEEETYNNSGGEVKEEEFEF